MQPWKLIDRGPLSGDSELLLFQRGAEFSIRLAGLVLMTSRTHGSEEAIASLACEPLAGRPHTRILVGGLGMGYTLAAALRAVGADAQVEVAELSEAVVRWNRGPLAHLAGNPLEDPRVTVRIGDFAALLKREVRGYDAIMNDVDNGPDGLLLDSNQWLYSRAGLRAAYNALRPGGVLTIWSVGPAHGFTRRLNDAGFEAREHDVRDRGGKKGRHHTVWVARRP